MASGCRTALGTAGHLAPYDSVALYVEPDGGVSTRVQIELMDALRKRGYLVVSTVTYQVHGPAGSRTILPPERRVRCVPCAASSC